MGVRVAHDAPLATGLIASFVSATLGLSGRPPSPPLPVLVCLGTDLVVPGYSCLAAVGDLFGPLVGTMLVESGWPLPLFGRLGRPVHAGNYREYQSLIGPDAGRTVLAVDSAFCMTPEREVGDIELLTHGLRPAAATPGWAGQHRLPETGNAAILGYVNRLQPVMREPREVDFSLVWSMARRVVAGLTAAAAPPEAPSAVAPGQGVANEPALARLSLDEWREAEPRLRRVGSWLAGVAFGLENSVRRLCQAAPAGRFQFEPWERGFSVSGPLDLTVLTVRLEADRIEIVGDGDRVPPPIGSRDPAAADWLREALAWLAGGPLALEEGGPTQ